MTSEPTELVPNTEAEKLLVLYFFFLNYLKTEFYASERPNTCLDAGCSGDVGRDQRSNGA